MDDIPTFNLFAVADQRGLEVWDVEAYPQSYFLQWCEYLNRKNKPPKE